MLSLPLVISVIMTDMMGGTQRSYEDTKNAQKDKWQAFFTTFFFWNTLEFYAQQLKLSFT